MIALSILAPWLFLRESFDISLTSSEIADLPPTAQDLISRRQYSALWFVMNIWWISGVLFVMGLIPLITGLILWAKKQHLLDQKEKLETEKKQIELEKLKRELESMSPAEIAAKGIKKTEETQASEMEEQPTASLITSNVQEYFEIESVFLNKLVDCFGEEKVLTQQRIGQTTYDAVLLSDDPRPTDVIFEIKRLTRHFDASKVNKIAQQLVFLTRTYRETTHRKVTAIVLFVIPHEDQNHVVVDKCVLAIRDQAQSSTVRIRPIIITEQELFEIHCSWLRDKVHNATESD